jgi:hypothetical protein
LGDGHHHLAPHDLAFQVRVGVVFAGAVVAVLGCRRVWGEPFQPIVVILQQAILGVIDVNTGGNVHGIDEAKPFLHAALARQVPQPDP